MVSRAVILAGGKGTRLAPYTTVLPKPLMPIGEMPVLEVVIRQLASAGVSSVTLCVGYLGSLLQTYFGDGSAWGVRIEYSWESEPLGTAGPLSLVPNLDEGFIVMNGDVLSTLDVRAMHRFHSDAKAEVTVALFAKQVGIDLGVVTTGKDEVIVDYVEKPTLSYDVSMGVYVMEPSALDVIPQGERFDLPALVLQLVASGRRVVGYRGTDTWLDIGRQEDLGRAAEIFERERRRFLG